MKAPFQRYKVFGQSMLPTLKPGQSVLCFNWAYVFVKPKIGDVVVLRKNEKDIIKRILECSDREFFVVGDNEKESTDSRNFGFINKADIVGKVIVVVR